MAPQAAELLSYCRQWGKFSGSQAGFGDDEPESGTTVVAAGTDMFLRVRVQVAE